MSGRFLVFYGLLVIFSCRSGVDHIAGIITSSDSAEVAYIQAGHGDTTLFFIHGWCINKEYWRNQFAYFEDRYKVVAIDLPGFGASSKNRTTYHFDQYVEDVRQCIDQLNLKNVILIGHSMSGDIVLKADSQYPEKIIGIIGVDNLHAPGSEPDSATRANNPAFYEYMLSSFDSSVINFATHFLFQPATPDSVKSKVMKDILSTSPDLAVTVLKALDVVNQQEKILMKRLVHPLILVNSDVTPVALDSLKAYCAKGVKVYTVHATGHYPMIEKPEEFNKALQKAIWQQ